MSYCGSDVRLVSVEERRNPYHHLLRSEWNHPRYDARKRLMMTWQKLWIDRFTATRNNYASVTMVIPSDKVIGDLWLNNVIDLDDVEPCYATNDIPLIIHAPTSPEIKGTEYIERAIRALEQQGLEFRYQRIEKMDNRSAQQIYRSADIVVDQVLLGGFGTLAVESMALGKPVCCYLIEEVKDEFFPDCPIVNSSVDNLTERLAWLIQHPQERVRLGREGRRFVEQHCDTNKVNRRLWDVYQELFGSRRDLLASGCE